MLQVSRLMEPILLPACLVSTEQCQEAARHAAAAALEMPPCLRGAWREGGAALQRLHLK